MKRRLVLSAAIFIATVAGAALLWLRRSEPEPAQGPATPRKVVVMEAPDVGGPPSPARAAAPDGTVTGELRRATLSLDRKAMETVGDALERLPEELPRLRRMAAEDTEARVRAHALRILGRRRDAELEGFFATRLREDPEEGPRENCCWALGELGGPGAEPALREAADQDRSGRVRAAAARALSRIKESR